MNKDSQRFGLIIQGPFTSRFKAQKNHIYDCNKSVKFILNNYCQYFDDITWKKLTANGWDQIADSFIEMYPVFFDARAASPVPSIGDKEIAFAGEKDGMTQVGEQRNESLYVNKSIFREENASLFVSLIVLHEIIFILYLFCKYLFTR